MAYKRVVVRCYHASDLSGSQQQQFADDVEARLEGTGIKGYFILGTGNNWLEWEGDETTVEDKLEQHLADARIADHDMVENTNVNSLNCDNWRAHTDPDLHCQN